MSEEKEAADSAPGGILPGDEEEVLRRQIRGGLEAEYERERAKQSKPATEVPAAELLRAERLRIIREEEDAFYAKRGLFRYKNHRGEYEWLTKEERDRRLAARREKRSRRSARSLLGRLNSESFLGDVVNGLIVVVVFAVAVLVFRQEHRPQSLYSVSVRSEPTGAAVFLNGEPVNAMTNAVVSIQRPGFYMIHVLRPGYRAVPPSVEIHVSDEKKAPVVSFSLYPEAGTVSPPPDPSRQ